MACGGKYSTQVQFRGSDTSLEYISFASFAFNFPPCLQVTLLNICHSTVYLNT